MTSPRFSGLALLVAAGLSLSACQTAQGVQSDVSSGFSSIKTALQNFRPFEQPDGTTAQPSAMALAANPQIAPTANDCPEVRIVSDLNQVHQFVDAAKPSPTQSISSIRMVDVQNDCKVADNNMVVDLTLNFEGVAGPKARTKPADKPSFAYPYFIAITNNQGSIVAKEIFAVTMAYEKGKNERTYSETIRQMIPATNESLKNYKVLIGFQLNEQELAYNRAIPQSTMAIIPDDTAAIEPANGQVIQIPVRKNLN